MTQAHIEELQHWGRNKSRDFMMLYNVGGKEDLKAKADYAREYYARKKEEGDLMAAEQEFIKELEKKNG